MAAALCAVAFVLLLSSPGHKSSSELGLSAIMVIAGLRLSWIVASRERRIHEAPVWIFVYVFMGLAPLLQIQLRRLPGTTPWVDPQLLPSATGIAMLGVLSLLLGTLSRRRRQSRPISSGPAVDGQRLTWLTVGILLIDAYYLARMGPSSIVMARADHAALRSALFADKTIQAVVYATVAMGTTVALVAHIHLWRSHCQTVGRALTIAMLSLTLLMAVNPINSPRYVVGTSALAVVAALGGYATLARFRTVTIVALIGLVVAFPVLDTFRTSLDSDLSLEQPADSLTSPDFDAFMQLTNTVDYVSTNGTAYGRQLLGVLLFWIPRSVWPDKPLDTGPLVAEYMGYPFTNLSSPIFAELYINGGLLLVVAGSWLLGRFLSHADGAVMTRLDRSGGPGVLASIMPFYLIILMRGSLLQAMSYLTVFVLCSRFVEHPLKRSQQTARAAGQRLDELGVRRDVDAPVGVPGNVFGSSPALHQPIPGEESYSGRTLPMAGR